MEDFVNFIKREVLLCINDSEYLHDNYNIDYKKEGDFIKIADVIIGNLDGTLNKAYLEGIQVKKGENIGGNSVFYVNKEILLYLFFGGLTFLVSIISYAFFNIQIGWNALVANIGSWILAVAFAYITNRIWVFDSNAETTADFIKEITSFVGGRVATLVIEELILFIFITNLGMNSMLVKIVAQVIVIVLNYVISKLIVFKK